MEYINVLKAAEAQKSGEAASKRYSLAVGPPKKDPKVKGVHSAAVQAFLKRKEEEIRLKEIEEKKKKEALLAKRKEMKHDKKARAMASRTKDNFHGYNGIPLEDKPKKRQRDDELDDIGSNAQAENEDFLTEEEMYEYSQSESEQEEIEEPPPPQPPPSKKQKVSHIKKPPSAAMNFAELLKLAEKKQYEPVELKPVKKNEERPRTAEEIRELEFLERKSLKADKPIDKHSKANGQVVKVHKSSSDKHSSSKERHSEDKKSKSSSLSRGGPPEKVKSGHSEAIKKHSDGSHKSEKHVPSASHSKISKVSSNGTSKPSSSRDHPAKQAPSSSSSKRDVTVNGKLVSIRPGGSSSSSGKPVVSSGSSSARPPSASKPSGSSSSSSARPSGSSGSARPISSSSRPPSSSSSSKPHASSGSVRPSSSSGSSSAKPTSSSKSVKPPPSSSGGSRPSSGGHSSSSSGPARPSSVSGSSRPASGPPSSGAKPKSVPSGKELARPNGGLPLSSRPPANSGPGRPVHHSAAGPGSKPKCTVVSETISSKNFGPKPGSGPVNGMRPGNPNGMRPGPPPGQRPMQRPIGNGLPPITSSYKRRIDDDEEYDSEMEDFIDDGGESQDEISKHIKAIFGYDRTRYKDESDYALRYMESSFREQQKEEARSLRLGIQEDLEEFKREQEELIRKEKLAKKMKKR